MHCNSDPEMRVNSLIFHMDGNISNISISDSDACIVKLVLHAFPLSKNMTFIFLIWLFNENYSVDRYAKKTASDPKIMDL